MSSRVAAAPPSIPGFEYISLVGSGGYADVFLFEQEMPNRRVAIKVLDPGAVPGGGAEASFTAEANLMAKVSAHPYIVQVFQSAIAPDGRPYLIMEYYPGPNYHERARSEQFPVAEALRVGVQLASAVETAHRAGILHRDIKPANVLTSEYWRPGLTDFGIAAAQGPETDTADGVSIPWSPPEALGEMPADRRGDIYSLAATIYTLISGRSPFEIPGGDNRQLALINRIERSPVPSTGRADVPASLERVLANAMAKDPAHRPATAAEFGRQLQAIESEMRLAVTALELADDSRSVRARSEDADDDSTRVKGVVEIRAQGETSGAAITGVPANPVAPPVAPPRRREGLLAEPDISDTVLRPATATPDVDDESTRAGPRRAWLIAGAAAVVLAIVVGIALLTGGGDDAPVDEQAEPQIVNDDVGGEIAVPPPPITEIRVTDVGDGTYRFTWDDRADVTYAVTPDGDDAAERVDTAEYVGAAECIEVEVIAASGLVSAPTRRCA